MISPRPLPCFHWGATAEVEGFPWSPECCKRYQWLYATCFKSHPMAPISWVRKWPCFFWGGDWCTYIQLDVSHTDKKRYLPTADLWFYKMSCSSSMFNSAYVGELRNRDIMRLDWTNLGLVFEQKRQNKQTHRSIVVLQLGLAVYYWLLLMAKILHHLKCAKANKNMGYSYSLSSVAGRISAISNRNPFQPSSRE